MDGPELLTTLRDLRDRRGLIVAGVQGFIGAGDEHFSPLDQAGGEKAGDGAKDDFLKEGGAHSP